MMSLEAIYNELKELHENGNMEWDNGKIPSKEDIEKKIIKMYNELKNSKGKIEIVHDPYHTGLVMFKGDIPTSYWIGISRWEFIDDKDMFMD